LLDGIILVEAKKHFATKKVVIGVAIVFVILASLFWARWFFSQTISFPTITEPRVNGYSVTNNGQAFAINVTNMDSSRLTVPGEVDVHGNSSGILCYVFQGETTLNPGETGTIIATFSAAYNGYSGPISAREIVSNPSTYTIYVEAIIPVPA